jgi:outer membrane protein, heavy metal efflux system
MKKYLLSFALGVFGFSATTALAQHEGHKSEQPSKPQQVPPSKPQPQSGLAGDDVPLAPQNQATGTQGENTSKMKEEQNKSLDELLKADPSNLLPRIGTSQRPPSGPVVRLEDLERIALEKNPTLGQASAEIRSAQGRRLQSGLYPNPIVGYAAEEVRGGASRGGQHGFFVEQTLIMGGKLGLSRNVAQQDVHLAEIEAEEQRIRVVSGVRLAFFQTLASQEMLEIDERFVQLARQTLATAQRLLNIGARDRSEVIQAEIALSQAQLRLKRQTNQHRQAWRAMAAVVGDHLLTPGRLEGNLEELPSDLNLEQLTNTLINDSPAVRIGRANAARAEAAMQRAKREPIPDLLLRGGFQQNRERNDVGRPVGGQGFAEVGITIPIFNRNQGNVQSARGDLERAQKELTRIELVLRERGAATLRAFEDSRDTVEQYKTTILPRAEELYRMQLKAWGQMAISYPVVLQAQRDLFDVQTEYVLSLRDAHAASIALQGFLLTDALEAPARPSETDLPIREINLPTNRGGMER